MQFTKNIPDEMAAEVESRLNAEALARGLPLESCIVEKLVGALPLKRSRRRTVAEAIESNRELRKSNRLGGMSVENLIQEGRRF
jgi:hypothetical protein